MEVRFSHLNTWEFVCAARGLLWFFSLSPLGGRGNRECGRERREAEAESQPESVETLCSRWLCRRGAPALAVGAVGKAAKLLPSPLQELPIFNSFQHICGLFFFPCT